MWRPKQRIVFKPEPGQWPGVKEARDSRLFSPVDLGPTRLENRCWVPAMVPWRASADGFVTADVLAWYERFARGRPGALVVEATGIRDIASGPLLRIGDDRFVDGLKELVETVREASDGKTRLFIQLIDFLTIRRRPDPKRFLSEFLKITERHREALDASGADDRQIRKLLQDLPPERLDDVLSPREREALHMGYRERVTDTHLPHIAELPQVLPDLFADAARRAQDAGFDGVELHYAHAYTMASFLSALNDRADGYGGDIANRVRLPLEVFAAVRGATSANFAVGCRYLSEDCIAGGNGVGDAEYAARAFAAAGFDFLSLSRGGKFEDAQQPSIGEAAYPYTGPSGYECMPSFQSDERGPFGRNVEPVARIKAALVKAGYDTPVIVAGGIHGFGQAEDILSRGEADLIGAARQSLADPDWYLKISRGRGQEIRTCTYSNYCEGLDGKHKQVTCKLWDREGLDEPDLLMSSDGRRRLVAPAWSDDGPS